MAKGRLAVISSLVGILILLIAACAPAATPTPTATPTPPPIVATPTPTAATPTTVAGVAGWPVGYGYSPFGEWGMPLNTPPPVYGDVFREASHQWPPFYDSHRETASTPVRPSSPVLDSLIRFSPYLHHETMPGTYELEYLSPNLAEKWEVSPDNLLVTFYLKRGVKWTDGKPFTSKDVKYTYEKLQDPSKSVWTANFAMIDRVEAVDDYTVKFYLKYPATRFFLMSVGAAANTIQPEHRKDVSYRTIEFIKVGTGPFIFKSFLTGVELVYEKNPDYHFKGRPYFDGLKYVFFANKQASLESFIVGHTDKYETYKISESFVALIKRVAPEVRMYFNGKFTVNSNIVGSYIKEGPWQDVRVRKAMTMVLDINELCVATYGQLSDTQCRPRTGYFWSAPAGIGLPFEEYEKAWGLNRPLAERVAEAKRLLAAAGYPDGFKASMLGTAEAGEDLLVAMDTWKKLLNIAIAMRIVSRAMSGDIKARGDYELGTQAAPVPITGAMEELVSGPFIKGGTRNNYFYEHPLVEELYKDLLKTPDRDSAIRIVHKIERLLIADVPIIYLHGDSNFEADWPYIKPKFFHHPMEMTSYGARHTVIWFDKNDPTWAKRAK